MTQETKQTDSTSTSGAEPTTATPTTVAEPTVIPVSQDGKVTKIITKPGTGPRPKRGQKATVHYTGKLTNGTEFDSSVGRDKPFRFQIGKGVISGWTIGVQTMKLGEKAIFTMSPEYGYGAKGAPPSIPPNSTLIFEIELLHISK